MRVPWRATSRDLHAGSAAKLPTRTRHLKSQLRRQAVRAQTTHLNDLLAGSVAPPPIVVYTSPCITHHRVSMLKVTSFRNIITQQRPKVGVLHVAPLLHHSGGVTLLVRPRVKLIRAHSPKINVHY